MGAKQSSLDKLSLAEKRYKINTPRKSRRRSQTRYHTMSLDRSTSIDENDRVIVHSNSIGKSPAISKMPASQKSVDSFDSFQTPITCMTMSPFFTDQQYVVTKKQRELIEDSWKRTHRSGTENVGSKAFLLILIAEPQIRQIFGLDKIPQGRLKYDPRFRKHAALISKSFDFAVKNIDFAEKLAQHFDGLGKKHALMQNRGFKPEYWKIFSDSMLETTNEINKCQKTANAWRVLIEFIVKHMKIGFEKEQLMRMRYLPTTTIIQKPTRNQLGVTRQPAIHEQMSPPGRSANERSSSWVGITSFSEDLSRLRITASQRYPKNQTHRQATAPEDLDRPESPNSSSDYYTPPSSRKNELEKMCFNDLDRFYVDV